MLPRDGDDAIGGSDDGDDDERQGNLRPVMLMDVCVKKGV